MPARFTKFTITRTIRAWSLSAQTKTWSWITPKTFAFATPSSFLMKKLKNATPIAKSMANISTLQPKLVNVPRVMPLIVPRGSALWSPPAKQTTLSVQSVSKDSTITYKWKIALNLSVHKVTSITKKPDIAKNVLMVILMLLAMPHAARLLARKFQNFTI